MLTPEEKRLPCTKCGHAYGSKFARGGAPYAMHDSRSYNRNTYVKTDGKTIRGHRFSPDTGMEGVEYVE